MVKEQSLGFKGFRYDIKRKKLFCKPYTNRINFEIGKTLKKNKPIKLCFSGFHFCEKLYNVNTYYSFFEKLNFFGEVKTGYNITDGYKSVTNCITLIKIIDKKEVLKSLRYSTLSGLKLIKNVDLSNKSILFNNIEVLERYNNGERKFYCYYLVYNKDFQSDHLLIYK